MTGSAIVGIDVGGTYTDVVATDGVRVFVTKILSTPGQPELSVLAGLRACAEAHLAAGEVVHGTTLATNSVLTRRGAQVALVMTTGFRDLLEMRRRDRPHTYGLQGTFRPLVPRDLRIEVAERSHADGTVEQTVDPDCVLALLEALPVRPESVAVCFLHSYVAPANEQAVGRRLLEAGFPYVSLSHEVLAEIKEFERTSTTVVNAFLQPVIDRYLTNLSTQCAEQRLAESVWILHSNGGAMSLDLARRFPVRTVMSGPAGGVLAAVRIGERAGRRNLITCDMGGTSFDAALIVDGRPKLADQMLIEFGIPVKTAMTDVLKLVSATDRILWQITPTAKCRQVALPLPGHRRRRLPDGAGILVRLTRSGGLDCCS